MADDQPQHGELAISKAQDIYSLTMKCQDLFSTYLAMSTSYTWQVFNYEWRFLTWANTLTVIDDESTCLDRRLRLSPDIKQLVMSMLSVLEEALERAIIRHPLIKTVVETDAAMFGITGAISRLERLVPIIQMRESPVAREAILVRRLVAKEWSNDYAPRISKSIQAKFPQAEPTLQAQLILSILYRRCRLIYHLSNSDKRQYEKGTENATPSALKSRQQHMADDKFSYPPSYPDLPEVAHGEGKPKCPCCLNTVIPQSENREEWRAQWESHLKADLQPYVCLSAECRHFFMFFSTVEEWKDHMQSHDADWIRNIHRTKWPCPFCNDRTTHFLTQDELEDHLIHDEAPKHPHSMDWDTLTVERSMKRNPRNKYCCPLCNEEQKDGTPSERSNQLYSHILAHLEVLALVSIDDWHVETSKTIDASIDRTNPLHCRSGPNHDQGKSTKRKILAYPKKVWNKTLTVTRHSIPHMIKSCSTSSSSIYQAQMLETQLWWSEGPESDTSSNWDIVVNSWQATQEKDAQQSHNSRKCNSQATVPESSQKQTSTRRGNETGMMPIWCPITHVSNAMDA